VLGLVIAGVAAGVAGREGDVAAAEDDGVAVDDGVDVGVAVDDGGDVGVVVTVGAVVEVVVGVVDGVVDGEVAGGDGEGVVGDVVGHGGYIPPHSCAKPEVETVTSKNVRKANLNQESLNIAQLLSAMG